MRSFIFLLLGVLILLSCSLKAQSTFGFRFGGVSSSARPAEEVDLDGENQFSRLPDLLAFQIGLGFSHSLSDRFDLDTDLTYARRGFQSAFQLQAMTEERKFILHYLNLPVNLHFRFDEGKLALVLGTQFSYLLADKYFYQGRSAEPEWSWRPIDLSLDFGFSFHLRPDLKFFFGVQYGLLPINNFTLLDNQGNKGIDPKIKTRVYQLSVYHYLLP